MESLSQKRFKFDWYSKKINQNKRIRAWLLEKIDQHKDTNFPWLNNDLCCLENEYLHEIAIATANTSLTVTATDGEDFDNGADAKLSIVRNHGYGKSYSSLINCRNKTYILATVYENIQDKFYFFAFPPTIAEHSIPFDLHTGAPKRKNYMWKHEYTTFEEMANSNLEKKNELTISGKHLRVKYSAKSKFNELFE